MPAPLSAERVGASDPAWRLATVHAADTAGGEELRWSDFGDVAGGTVPITGRTAAGDCWPPLDLRRSDGYNPVRRRLHVQHFAVFGSQCR
jgi:hypothetical protein